VSSKQLQDYCRKNLAKYKVPSILEIVKEIPKTAVGKSTSWNYGIVLPANIRNKIR